MTSKVPGLLIALGSPNDPGRLVVISSDFHPARVKYIFDRPFAAPPLHYTGEPQRASEEERRKLARHEEAALEQLRRSDI